ncbi:MAG: PD-(D/E)XK nuclease family protein, partial [Deferribacterales bacterium]
IVLPDEKNLFPLLTQFKKDDGINVTMGYSLTNTEFGIFVNSLFEVLTTIYQRYIKGGQIFVPTIPLLKLLDSGIIRRLPASFFDYQSLNREIFDRKLSIFELKDDYLKFFERFIKVKSFEDFYQIMYEVVNSIELKENDEILLESIKVFTKDILIPLKNINIDNISMNIALIANIVTNLMDDAALLFEGNPIKGVQIMGALESRYLPLNTVVYIDLNEGVIPSVNPIDPLIPEEIKRELGLSSYSDREKLQRYNFFRTIFSCKKSVLIYKAGGNSNDKYLRSRFIDQLILLREVDSNKRYNVKKSTVNIIPSIVSEDGVKKDDDTYGIIIEQMKNKGFTPTILDEYITCPYMFYFKRIKGIPAKVNFYNNFEADKAGSLMHLILQKSFEDKLGKKLDNNLLEDALSKGKGLIDGLPKSIEKFSNYFTTFFEKMDDLRFDMLKIVLNKRFEQYINFQKGNLVNEEIEIKGLEIELYDKELAVRGIADRIEEVKFKDDSVSLRVIDYKTGRVIKTFSNGRLNKIDMNNLDIKYCRDGIKYIKEKIPSVQLPVYILMASRCYDNYGSYESVIYKLGNSQNIKGSSFKVNIDNEDFDKLKKLVSYIINHIVQSCYFYALPGDNCQYCEYSYCCKFER